MSDVLITMTQLQIGTVPLQTITDWVTAQLNDAKKLLILFAGVAVLGLTIWRVIKSGFAFGAMLMAAIAAGFAIWLFGGGVDTISSLMDEQASK